MLFYFTVEGARGVAWSILLALGARNSGSNPGGPIFPFSGNFGDNTPLNPFIDFIEVGGDFCG